jgi:hypothetical protein
MSIGLLILIILIVLVVAAYPRWGYSSGWGYGPMGILGLILIIIVVLMLTGNLGSLNLR